MVLSVNESVSLFVPVRNETTVFLLDRVRALAGPTPAPARDRRGDKRAGDARWETVATKGARLPK